LRGAAQQRRRLNYARASASSFASILALLLLFVTVTAHASAKITATRMWPSQDYTRLTIESDKPLQYKMFSIPNPPRLVLDLDNADLDGALRDVSQKVEASDPFVKDVRVGRFKPHVVRVVLDLKDAVKPQVFTLDPVGEYGYRLVLDVYPVHPIDPLMALVAAQENGGKAGTVPAKARQQAPAPDRPLIIAVDAGHGGEDPGATGPGGTHEKNVTLAIARKLKKLIDAEPDMRAVMTRKGDYFVPLHTRVLKARAAKADIFVSIHADSCPHFCDAQGSSVFALSEHGATSAMARWLAKSENDSDLIGGIHLNASEPYLKRTLLDLSQTVTIADSLKLGTDVLTQLDSIGALHKSNVEQAGFAVLKAPDIPSILVETAYISNRTGERRLNNPSYQEKLAKAILAGLNKYVAQDPMLSGSRVAKNN
jgi:N-acetylmuramoyl-L-alanine amidase